MTFSLRTHITKMGRGETVVARVTPYIRLRSGENPPIFVQGGAFYWEGGQRVKDADLPDWVEPELDKLTPEVRREAGLK